MKWLLYLIMLGDDVNLVCSFVMVFGAIATAILWFISSFSDDDDRAKAAKSIVKKVFTTTIIGICIGIMTPTTKEMAAIYVIPKIMNNEQFQQLPDNLLNLVNEWAKEQLKTEKEEK